MLNIICVNANDYLGRGDDYVNALVRGVKANLNGSFDFHILSEKDSPQGVSGWWHKLSMFQPGRFEGRCLYFDLDTAITGSLDDIAKYDGPFAGISDFYNPHLLQSAIMSWRAGEADLIFNRWEALGFPQFHPAGDGGWVNDMMPDAVRLQDEFPGQIVSFKADCRDGIPDNARAVCFHGNPRPHFLADLMKDWHFSRPLRQE